MYGQVCSTDQHLPTHFAYVRCTCDDTMAASVAMQGGGVSEVLATYITVEEFVLGVNPLVNVDAKLGVKLSLIHI